MRTSLSGQPDSCNRIPLPVQKYESESSKSLLESSPAWTDLDLRRPKMSSIMIRPNENVRVQYLIDMVPVRLRDSF